jgi:transposase, IS6 family
MGPRRLRPAPIAHSAFAGFCFPPDVIVLAVRWYLRLILSYRDVEELLAERGIKVDHTTVYRWVVRFTPLLAAGRSMELRQGGWSVTLRVPGGRPVRAGHRRSCLPTP